MSGGRARLLPSRRPRDHKGLSMRPPLDLTQIKVLPLAKRQSLTRVEDILIDPQSPAPQLPDATARSLDQAAARLRHAKARGASIMLIYGAHLLRNGAALILDQMMASGWLTHVATNGAGTIHDWEYAWCGASTESVEMGVAHGQFGTWHETALHIHMAILSGALDDLGYGRSMGRFISDDGVTLPEPAELEQLIRHEPGHHLTGPRAELLRAMQTFGWKAGRYTLQHPWKHASILASAYRHGVAATAHPGIGYDIISNHPVFNGAALGRAGELDFKLFAGAVEGLDDGVVLSVGSAIMGPQVFEKTISCVNNIRMNQGRPVVRGHSIYVVDLQDGGQWDWSQGEPPKTHPAYYLRFCKSYSRMGAAMQYVQCDNVAFMHGLWERLR
jgi:hypothetical protein